MRRLVQLFDVAIFIPLCWWQGFLFFLDGVIYQFWPGDIFLFTNLLW
jgi:hypothetical protein